MPTQERIFDGEPSEIYDEVMNVVRPRRDFYVTAQVQDESLYATGRKSPNTTVLAIIGIVGVVCLFIALLSLVAILLFIVMAAYYASSPNNTLHLTTKGTGDGKTKVTFTVIGKESVNFARYISKSLEESRTVPESSEPEEEPEEPENKEEVKDEKN